MKILVIHNFHRKGSASGDDQVFKSETDLLEKYGNQVIRYSISNDEFDHAGLFEKMFSTLGMFWSFKNYKSVKNIVKKEKPDIVHVHTFFPLLSPSVLYAAKNGGSKVVATLHDTRFVCPCATSLRGMQLCNECSDGKYFRMCKYGCFKQSKLQSFIVACIFKYHRWRKSFHQQIDKYICLNDKQIHLLQNVGFDENKIIKKYNFISDAEVNVNLADEVTLPERFVVYYGRIGEEKGIRRLMNIWEKISDIPLVVMGGGPLEEEFSNWARKQKQVHYLGYMQRDLCLAIAKKAEFVVFPSIWYEGCSMVVVEAECLGKSIVATDLGFSSEAIEDGVNGYKTPLGDDDAFAQKVKELWNAPERCAQMGENARKDYLAKYLPDDNYRQLMSVYESLLKD